MSRDSGFPLVPEGNIAVDFVYGNFPLQPNNDRPVNLGVGDNHNITNTVWNSFPDNGPATGRTLEGGDAFYWPKIWLCDGADVQSNRLLNVIDEFVSYGVPRAYFKDFTFAGGANKWDSNGTPNWDGAILYSYVPADVVVGTDWLGQPIYGSAWDNVVFGGNRSAGYEDSVDSGNPEDYMLYVFSNDPRKNNVGWWWL